MWSEELPSFVENKFCIVSGNSSVAPVRYGQLPHDWKVVALDTECQYCLEIAVDIYRSK